MEQKNQTKFSFHKTIFLIVFNIKSDCGDGGIRSGKNIEKQARKVILLIITSLLIYQLKSDSIYTPKKYRRLIIVPKITKTTPIFPIVVLLFLPRVKPIRVIITMTAKWIKMGNPLSKSKPKSNTVVPNVRSSPMTKEASPSATFLVINCFAVSMVSILLQIVLLVKNEKSGQNQEVVF